MARMDLEAKVCWRKIGFEIGEMGLGMGLPLERFWNGRILNMGPEYIEKHVIVRIPSRLTLTFRVRDSYFFAL